jgi:general secretion pathway protein J
MRTGALFPRRRQVNSPRRRPGARSNGGFTLIELLVAISVMALLAVLSWRGLDGMARSQAQTSQRADEVLNLQAGLGQWKVDLDSLTQTPQITSLAWDGRVLRLTRRATTGSDGLVVVAWTRRGEADGQWLRWQSPPVRTLGGWTDAWNRANVWSQTASAEDRVREVLIAPLTNWQIFYFRDNAWSNSLSSAGSSGASVPGSGQTGAPVAVPDGIRLVLELPPGQPINGRMTMDWVRPTLGGDR